MTMRCACSPMSSKARGHRRCVCAQAGPVLAKLVREGSQQVRHQALAALASIGGTDAIKLLSQTLENGPRELVSQAAGALAQSQDEAAKKALFAAAQNPRRDVA